MIKEIVVAFIVLCLLGGCADSRNETPAADPAAAPTAFARTVIKDFAPRLQSALQAAMAEGGPMEAVTVCHSEAAAIALEAGARHGAVVRRTSLRPRNPANAPDGWERETLLDFEAETNSGRAPGDLTALTARREGGRQRYRFMQPIVVQPLCLTCHGEELAPELAATLDGLYPEDQARGYKVGDLRGAFSVSWSAAD